MKDQPAHNNPRDGAREDASHAATAMRSCLGTRINRLQRLVGRRYELALRPLGLSMAQLETLSALQLWVEPARPGDLADVLCVERSTMSRNLSLMERRGWVTAASVTRTGRSQTVTLTEDGRRVLADAAELWARVQTDVAVIIGEEAAPHLDAWLAALAP